MPERGAELVVDRVKLAFGGQRALDDVSLVAEPGTLLGLVGPNGAGKTSLVNCISGLYHPSSGSIEVDGRDLLRQRPSARMGLGIGRTFQHMQLLDDHSVLDNVLVGLNGRMRSGIFLNALYVGPVRAQERRQRGRALEALAGCGIQELADRKVAALSYGQRKLVDLARGLAAEPRLLLLDEPMAGLTADERAAMAEVILGLRAIGITQVMIEHDIDVVRRISDALVVLDYGRVLAAGKPEEVLARPQVVEAYLGVAPDEIERPAQHNDDLPSGLPL